MQQITPEIGEKGETGGKKCDKRGRTNRRNNVPSTTR
jgi:hypothetical protein